MLVYGVTPELQKAFDFASTHLELAVVLSESKKHGAMAVPCHPGRPKVGMFAHTDELGIPEGVEIVEIHNGASRDQEDQIAIDNAVALNYRGIAGSDSHIVSHIGRCATKFSRNINSINDLVEALKAGEFEAVNLKTAG